MALKILVERKSRRILGCHILGSNASILVHEVLAAIRDAAGNGTVDDIIRTVLHPALSEVGADSQI